MIHYSMAVKGRMNLYKTTTIGAATRIEVKPHSNRPNPILVPAKAVKTFV